MITKQVIVENYYKIVVLWKKISMNIEMKNII